MITDQVESTMTRQHGGSHCTVTHRHVDFFVRLQSLFFEAETLNLVEVDASLHDRWWRTVAVSLAGSFTGEGDEMEAMGHGK